MCTSSSFTNDGVCQIQIFLSHLLIEHKNLARGHTLTRFIVWQKLHTWVMSLWHIQLSKRFKRTNIEQNLLQNLLLFLYIKILLIRNIVEVGSDRGQNAGLNTVDWCHLYHKGDTRSQYWILHTSILNLM